MRSTRGIVINHYLQLANNVRAQHRVQLSLSLRPPQATERYRQETSWSAYQREPSFSDSLSGIFQSLSNILFLKVRICLQYFFSAHSVGYHTHYRCHWNTQPSDARYPSHFLWFNCDTRKFHLISLPEPRPPFRCSSDIFCHIWCI